MPAYNEGVDVAVAAARTGVDGVAGGGTGGRNGIFGVFAVEDVAAEGADVVVQAVRADLADAGEVLVVGAQRPLGIEREVSDDGLGQVEVVLALRIGAPAGDLVGIILRQGRRGGYRAAKGDDLTVEQLALRAVFKPDPAPKSG